MEIKGSGQRFKEVPANELKVGDEIFQHGGMFLVREVKVSQSHDEIPGAGKVHANICEFLGEVDGWKISIPVEWRVNWNCQGNANHKVLRAVLQ